MRTTLNIDDNLLERARAQFPPGTPKTVVLEEALRRLINSAAAPTKASALDPRLQRLLAAGVLTPATEQTPPAPPGDGVPYAQLLADLDADRADR